MTGNAPTHTCSYFCDKPECIKAQRDELREKLAALDSQPVPVEPDVIREKRSLVELHGLGGSDKEIIKHIDALLSRIQVAQQERDGKWHRCPSCNNDFKQPFLCTTCGAEKLYDATLQSANQRAEQAEAKLAAIRSQPAPVEPECITKMRRLPKGAAYEVEHKTLDYIDTLQSALHRAQEKYEQAVSNKQIAEAQCAELLQRAEKAEADLKLAQEERDAANDKALRVLRGQFTQICSYCGWEANREGAQWTDLQSHIKQCEHHPLVKAESINRRMVELLKEPSEGMKDAAYKVVTGGYSDLCSKDEIRRADCLEIFKAMSAALLKEVGQ